MTFLSASFKYVLCVVLMCGTTRIAAQDHFFEFFISDYPHPVKAFQFSADDRHFLVSTYHEFESTPERFIPSHYQGKVYEVSTGKRINTFTSRDAVRWLPGTDQVVVAHTKKISVLSLAGDTVQTVDWSNPLQHTNDKIKKLVLAPDGRMIAIRSEQDSIYVQDISGSKALKKLNTRITGFQYPEFTGNNQYLAAQTGASWAWELWNLETGIKVDSFRLYDRFWLKPKQYFINRGDHLQYLNDLSKRKLFTRSDRDVLDPSAKLLARTYRYNTIEILDLTTGNVVQQIPLEANETWKVFVNTKTLVVNDFSGDQANLRFFNVEFGEEILSLPSDHLNQYMDFHPHKSLFLATGKEDLILFECSETSIKKLFTRKIDQLYYTRFSKSGNFIIVLAKDKIELYNREGARVAQISIR